MSSSFDPSPVRRVGRQRRVRIDWRLPVFIVAALGLVVAGIFVVQALPDTDRETSWDSSDDVQELTLGQDSPDGQPSDSFDDDVPSGEVSDATKVDAEPAGISQPHSQDAEDVTQRPEETPSNKDVRGKVPPNHDPHAQRPDDDGTMAHRPNLGEPQQTPSEEAPPAQSEEEDLPDLVSKEEDLPDLTVQNRSIPASNLLKSSRKKVKKEFSPWPRARDEQIAQVRSMIALSADRSQGHGRQYVLLEMGRELAAKAGNLEVAWQAIDQMSSQFDVDGLRLKADLLIPLSKTASAEEPSGKKVGEYFRQILSETIHADRFEIAGDVQEAMRVLARRWQDGDLRRAAAQHADLVRMGKPHSKRINEAKKVLKTTPNDPQANQTLGEFYSYVAGDWSRGVSYLQQCDDPALKKAATAELGIYNDPDGKMNAGKAWMAVASKLKRGKGAAKWMAQMRARKWLLESWRESGGEAKKRAEETLAKEGLLHINPIGMRLMKIPAGSFVMGSPPSEEGREKNKVSEKLKESKIVETQHRVRISRDFYIGMFEVTQVQYNRVMGKNPSESAGKGQQPVEKVSWLDAARFCQQLGGMDKGTRYRLPTEAEWEYACRAGTQTAFFFGDALTSKQAAIGLSKPKDVGSFAPNAFGLFDMHGNVGEWVMDSFQPGIYSQPATDPKGNLGVRLKVPTKFVRGGWFNESAGRCRSAERRLVPLDKGHRTVGFRVVIAPR